MLWRQAAIFKTLTAAWQRCHRTQGFKTVKTNDHRRKEINLFLDWMILKRRFLNCLLKNATDPSVATTNWPLEGMQRLLLDWHLLLAAPVGWGGGLVEGDSGGRSSGDKPPCPLSLRQQRKWVMFVWKPRAAIPLVLMCGPPGMRVSISTRAERRGRETGLTQISSPGQTIWVTSLLESHGSHPTDEAFKHTEKTRGV